MISLRFFRKNKVILVHIFLTFELTFPGCFLQYFQPALRRQTGHNRLIFDTNHGLFSDCFQEKSRGLFLSEKGRLAKCLTRQILNKKVCTSAHCRSALQSGQMQTQNQMKGVLPCRSTSQPGTSAAQNSSPSPTGCIWAHRKPRVWTSWNSAAGAVERVCRHPPHPARGRHAGRAAGAGRSRLRRRGPELYRLGQRRVDAGRCQRQWLHRLHPARPVRRPRHPPHRGGGEELTPSIYEQFIARVVDSANAAAEAAKRAASGEANAKQSASEAASSAQQTAASATLAAGYAEQAEAAADPCPPPMPPRRALC